MLQAIRERAQGIFAWVLLIIIGVPFALWGIQNYFSSGKETPVAVVGDRDIFEREVTRSYEEMLASLGGLGDFDEKMLKRQALDRVIRDELIRQATKDARIVVGDQDVRTFIESMPYFQTDGRFDREKYKMALASQNLASPEFTEQVRVGLAMEQYQKGIAGSTIITAKAVESAYRLKNQKREFEYMVVPLAKVDPAIDDASVQAYYEQHRSEFQDPETVSVDYVMLTMEAMAEAVKPTDAELQALYEQSKANFTTKEQRRISHILVAVAPGKPDADKVALDKIKALHERLKKGEDFAKLAKEASEDPASASKGGDLGLLSPGMLDPSFEKAAAALGKGAVSEPVKTPFGYHLIRITELTPAVVKPFSEVRAELAKTFQRNAVDSRFYELGQKLTELAFEHPDSLEPAAQAIGKPVERSKAFTRDGGEGIGAEAAIRKAAFSDDVLAGKNSELIEISPERVAVVRVYDHRPLADRPIEVVKGDIQKKLKLAKAREQTKQTADELRKKLDAGAAFAATAKSAGIAVVTPAAAGRDAKDIPAALAKAVFAAGRPREDGKGIVGLTSLDDGSQVLYHLKAVVEQAPKPDDEELAMIRSYLANAAGQSEFTAWVGELRRIRDVEVKPAKE